MKKYLLLIIVCILSITLCGCSKKVISTGKFTDITSNYKLKSKDVTKQYKGVKDIKNVVFAVSEDGWQIEFYVYENQDETKKMFENNMKYYNDKVKNSIYHEKNTSKKVDEYTIVEEERYTHVCRVKNTLLYVTAPIDSKTDVEKVLRALKY